MKALTIPSNIRGIARPNMWEGIIIIDKPTGMSSNKVLQYLRRIANFQKMGYLGTLDPLATGVLPIFIGWATKIIPFIDQQTKAYQAAMVLGQKTDTQDATGQVVFTTSQGLPGSGEIQAVCNEFIGTQEQVPPSFSAVKYKGKPLYHWARQGIRIAKPPRQITIESFEVLKMDGERVTFEIRCSPGTYVRTVCHDIGERLGCGAYLQELRRTQSGWFTLAQAHTLEEVEQAVTPEKVLSLKSSIDPVLEEFPQISADWHWRDIIRQGGILSSDGGGHSWPEAEPGRPICIRGPQGDLWAMYHQVQGTQKVLKPLRVII
ncbi:MAG TPA: tRNA pseudouridine(55) synthase TruB [Thermodesulfobacteriota bacterium]|nr:tRNA pseudouridine(55) synthase TruB [Thermodesulfobacteriota bacterium]